MSEFTERHLLSDYKFLEEAARLNDVAQRSEVPRPARQLPHGLQMFVDEVCKSQAMAHLFAWYANSAWCEACLGFLGSSSGVDGIAGIKQDVHLAHHELGRIHVFAVAPSCKSWQPCTANQQPGAQDYP